MSNYIIIVFPILNSTQFLDSNNMCDLIIFPNDLGLEVRLNGIGQALGVQRQSLGDAEAPVVTHLTAHVQVQLGDQQAVATA